MRQDGGASSHARGTLSDACALSLFAALGLAAAFGLSVVQTFGSARPGRPTSTAASPFAALDPSRFILNSLLVPALDADAVPLRWVDPRPALLCGPGATVTVNGRPLLAGTLVPDTPFELEWQTDACRPYGARGARFDGRVRLTVSRDDWGFRALVEPLGLRVTPASNSIGAEPGNREDGSPLIPDSTRAGSA